jgi:hypothetical protein
VSTYVSLGILSEPILWPDYGAIAPTNIVNVIWHPSPPPMLTHVQTLQEALDVHHHIYGEPTSKITCDITLAIVGHVVTTMWIVSKL